MTIGNVKIGEGVLGNNIADLYLGYIYYVGKWCWRQPVRKQGSLLHTGGEKWYFCFVNSSS